MSLTLTRRHNVDRFGYFIPTKYGNVPMVGAVATYRPGEGRFGGAVAVEEGTTNLVANGGFNVDLSGWATTGSPAVDTQTKVEGGGATLLSGPGLNGNTYVYQDVPLAAGVTYTLSYWVKTEKAKQVGTRTDGGSRVRWAGRVNFVFPETQDWTYYQHTFTPSSDLSGRIEFSLHDTDTNGRMWVDGVQLEAKPFPTSFVDGTRPDGILAYPIALPENHTIACYRKSHTDEGYKHVVKRSDGKVFVDGVEDSEYDVGWIAGRNLVLDSATEHTFTNTVFRKPLRVDVFHEMIGEQLTLSFYAKAEIAGQMMDCYLRDDFAQVGINGSKWGPFEVSTEYTRYAYTIILEDISDVNRLSFAFRNTGAAGGSVRGAVSVKNIKIEKDNKATDWTPAPEDLGYSDDCLMFSNQTGLIDELLILPYAASEEEIVSWYEAQGPLPPHPQASLQWDRQAVTRRHNVDRFGYLIPHRYGNLPMVGAVATYRPGEGRFGGAVAVEEGTTNYLKSCDFETWTSYVAGNATGTVEFRQDPIYGKVVKLKKTDSGSERFGLRGTLSGLSGSIYTYSVYVRALSGTGRICMYVDAARTDGGLITSSRYRNLSDLPLGQWVRITATKDGSPDTLAGGGHVYVWVDTDNGECEFAYPQVEAKPFTTSFVDGSRAKGALHYDGNQLSVGANEGTFSMWMYVDVSIPRGGEYPRYPQQCWLEFESGSLWCRSYFSNRFDLLASTNDGTTAINVIITNTGWHLWTATWSDGEASLYIDGSKVGSSVLGDSAPSGRLRKLYVGCGSNNPAAPGSLFDEVLILPYAASEEEIASWYEAQGPLPPHPQASLQWDRQMVRPAQMVKL